YLSPFLFFFSCSGSPRALHSFPTRRSSDLLVVGGVEGGHELREGRVTRVAARAGAIEAPLPNPRVQRRARDRAGRTAPTSPPARSEEHTSELQSPYDLVCRLLLEKKKKR